MPDPSEELKMLAPEGLREPLRELLNSTPGVSYSESGWLVREFTINAPPGVLAVLEPRIKALECNYSNDVGW